MLYEKCSHVQKNFQIFSFDDLIALSAIVIHIDKKPPDNIIVILLPLVKLVRTVINILFKEYQTKLFVAV